MLCPESLGEGDETMGFHQRRGWLGSGRLAASSACAANRKAYRVLMLYPENDTEGQLRATAFRQGLQKLGWTVGGRSTASQFNE